MGPDTSVLADTALGAGTDRLGLPRRLRHVSCIQVCNFTPFPVRDAVTSALSQPVEQSQLNTLSHLSDDLDVSARKRTRKISATSISTRSSGRQEDDESSHFLESRGRKTSHTRRSFKGGSLGSDTSPVGVPRISYSSPQTVRRRGRTGSVTSIISGRSSLFSSVQGKSIPGAGSSFSMVLPDISQCGLEKVINSRLIETFLTITVLPAESVTPIKPGLAAVKTSASYEGTKTRKTAPIHRTYTSTSSLPTGAPNKDRPVNGAPVKTHAQPRATRVRSAPNTPRSKDTDTQGSSSHSSQRDPLGSHSVVPDYFSPIHRASVNPTFPVDVRSGRDLSFSPRTTASRLKVQLWGHIRGKGTGMQEQREAGDLIRDESAGWNIMQEWEFSLDDLVPLPRHVVSYTADLPSNVLLVTLTPSEKLYYLPSFQAPSDHPPTPSFEYSSDSEFISQKARQDGRANESTISRVVGPHYEDLTSSRIQPRESNDGVSTLARGPVCTAAYQQLFELVSLQSLIRDHEAMLSESVRKIDKYFEDNLDSLLRRNISERQRRLGTIQVDSRTVVEEMATKKKELELRRQKVEERKRFLVSARILEEANLLDAVDIVQEIEKERSRLETLGAKFAPIRVGLLSTLASIYPIELDSPPDLLYTILDVPLPIPLTATDPAPPLSLPNHRRVHEDAVATALGFVAQLLQLLAVYLGKALIYPVTCVGSRSFIKDGISAMVGPRMFPLFSKGVDTYRFEYGVFLLNKNIEMLMIDRELRALDMRHTLPNLKNVVLTVTHGEMAPLNRQPPPDSPALSMAGLNSPTQEEPSNDVGSVTPKAKGELELPDEPTTPPASGSTTPTAGTADEKKYRPFLGLPFPDFLRGRYPSSSRASVKSVPGAEDGGRSLASNSGESDGSEAPEACGDSVENDVKALSTDIEQVPNRSSHEALADRNEISLPECKVGEATTGSESTSIRAR